MKKIFQFIKEKSHILMLAGMILLIISLLYVFKSNHAAGSKQIEYAVTGIAVIIYIIGRIGAALQRSENKKRHFSQSDDGNDSAEKKSEE